MKKIIALTAVASLLLFSAFAQKNKNKEKHYEENEIKGSGNMVTRDVPVQSFTELEASGVYQLTLIQGAKEGVKIEADDNLQDLFEVKNEGSKLIVSMKKDSNYNSKNKLKVSISFKQLSNLQLRIVGNVTSQGSLSFGNLEWDNKSVGSVNLAFNAKKLDLNNKSVGDMNLSGKADEAVIKHKGIGSLDAAKFVVENMDINNDGMGSVEVNATKQLKVKDSFMGKVKNVGTATPKKKVVI
jgi:putative autotransporter adhesin-like protein